ncbi:hypothetical protein DYI21_00060 [Thalassospira tepidiphila]|uniref:hypothetical protein n=1 Tax=Thalassospira tepidiphila TaxID=393657 RepID=UPI001BD0C7A6|nr:hypothetical protein [Thalassospira tepidiphila]MBS8271985.1 hypothetical protein [Thalassospira tepidiphila]
MASYKKLSGEIDQETSARRLHGAPTYDKWRRDDLYHLAAQKGIKNRANMSNEELVAALRQTQSGGGSKAG